MALRTDIRGMSRAYPDFWVVGREKIREYADAVKATDPATFSDGAAAELGHHACVAPPTFITIFALLLQDDFFRHVDIGLQALQILQVEQKFLYHKPVRAGDRLWGRVNIESVEERFGADIVVVRNLYTDQTGELVVEAYTTMMGQAGSNSARIKM
jgi:meromycolic acid (3R)-3-hydroxyacyl-[acyl-carrier protein] dehydratase HadC